MSGRLRTGTFLRATRESPISTSRYLPSVGRTGIRRYFANTSWLIVERVARAAVALTVGVLVARYLGPADFGLLSFASSFVGLFAVVATLGVDNVLTRELVQSPAERDRLLGSAFLLKLVASGVSLVLICFAAFAIYEDATTRWLVVLIAAGLLFQATNVVDMYFQSRVQSKFVVYVQFVQLLISSIMRIVGVFTSAPVIWFGLALLVDSVSLAVGLLWVYRAQGLSLSAWRVHASWAKRLLRSAWPLMLAGAMTSIYMKIDQVMIKEMLGSQAVGEYAVAVRLTEVWYLVPMVIASSVFPAIVQARIENRALYEFRIRQLHQLFAWIALLAAIPTSILAADVVRILFGDAFQAAGPVLTIQIWAGVFVFLGVASGKYLLAEDLTRVAFMRTAAGCAANVILNLLFIPKWGVVGAAWATVISYAVATLSIGISSSGRKAFWWILLSVLPVRIRQVPTPPA